MATFLRILLFVIAGPWISTIRAEDVANKPDLQVGDVWFFHATGEDDGNKVDRRWRRRIEEIMPDGRMRVAPLFDTDLFDASWNPIYRDHPDTPSIVFRFPMRVGDAWSFASTGAMTVDGRSYESRSSMKVVAYEELAVPAGTFRCFRVEGETFWDSAINAQNPDWRYTENWQITYWYCPDVRYVGRALHRRYVNVFGHGAYRVLDHQLIRHQAADATAHAHSAASKDAPGTGK